LKIATLLSGISRKSHGMGHWSCVKCITLHTLKVLQHGFMKLPLGSALTTNGRESWQLALFKNSYFGYLSAKP